VVLTAAVPNWSPSNTIVQTWRITENRQLVIYVADIRRSFSGVLQQAGRVALSGTLSQDLSVSLSSSSPSNLAVPGVHRDPGGSEVSGFRRDCPGKMAIRP
jgi:hypothetical protein